MFISLKSQGVNTGLLTPIDLNKKIVVNREGLKLKILNRENVPVMTIVVPYLDICKILITFKFLNFLNVLTSRYILNLTTAIHKIFQTVKTSASHMRH